MPVPVTVAAKAATRTTGLRSAPAQMSSRVTSSVNCVRLGPRWPHWNAS
jgi:hypothetical protein